MPRKRAKPSEPAVEPEPEGVTETLLDGNEESEAGPEVEEDTSPPAPPAFVPRPTEDVMRDLQIDELTEGQRADVLRASGRGGAVEGSLDRARSQILAEREHATRAVLSRLEPKEYKGKDIEGQIKSWEGKFDLIEIEEWARKYRRGGKYKIQLYDGQGDFAGSKEFRVEGDPALPGEVVEVPPPPPPAVTAAAAALLGHEPDRAMALERALMEERFQRRLEEQRAETRQMFTGLDSAVRSLADSMKAMATQPRQSLVDVVTALAGAPLLAELVRSRQASEAAAAAASQKHQELVMAQQAASEARIMKLMETMAGKRDHFGDVVSAVKELKTLTAGSEGTEAKTYNKILDHALPALINAVTKIQLHKAGVPSDEGDGEPESPMRYVMDKVTELAQGFFAARQSAGPSVPQAAPTMYGPPVQTRAQAGAPAVVPQIPAGPRGAAVLDRGPSVVVPRPAPVQPTAPPPVAGAPPVAPGPSAAAPAVSPAVVAAPPPAVPVGQTADVNGLVFVKALEYMNAGKGGDELADDLMSEEEANQKAHPGATPIYLSLRAVAFMVKTKPEIGLTMLLPYAQRLTAEEPAFAKLLDPVGQSFLLDFLRYFEPGDESPENDFSGGAAPAGGGQ